MLFNERDVRQNGIIGKNERLSFIGAKVFDHRSGRAKLSWTILRSMPEVTALVAVVALAEASMPAIQSSPVGSRHNQRYYRKRDRHLVLAASTLRCNSRYAGLHLPNDPLVSAAQMAVGGVVNDRRLQDRALPGGQSERTL